MSLSTLLLRAANSIEENAQALRECHSLDGEWSIEDEVDAAAQEAYDNDMRLVAELREAIETSDKADYIARKSYGRASA